MATTRPTRALSRDTALNLFGQLTPLVIALVTIPTTIRGLGVDRFGILALGWAILGSAAVVDGALGRAVTKFASAALALGDREAAAVTTRNAARAQLLLGIAGALALALLTPWVVKAILDVPPALGGETRAVFWLVAAGIPAVLVTGCFRGLLEALGRFDLVNVQRVTYGSMTYAIPWLGVVLGWSLPTITAVLVATRILSAATHAATASSRLTEMRGARADRSVGAVVLFGGQITVASLILSLHRLSDRFLVGALSTLSAVGQFSVASEIAIRLAVIPASVVGAAFPALAAAKTSRDRVTERAATRRMAVLLLVLMGPPCAVLIAAAHPILSWWLDAPMADAAATPLRLLTLGAFVSSFAAIAIASLHASGHPEIVTRLRLWLASPLFLAQWCAVATWGIDGAAWGALARYMIEAATMTVAARVAATAESDIPMDRAESPRM